MVNFRTQPLYTPLLQWEVHYYPVNTVSLRASLDVLQKRKISCPNKDLNSELPASSLVTILNMLPWLLCLHDTDICNAICAIDTLN